MKLERSVFFNSDDFNKKFEQEQTIKENEIKKLGDVEEKIDMKDFLFDLKNKILNKDNVIEYITKNNMNKMMFSIVLIFIGMLLLILSFILY
jgi:hypothetical protein